MTKAWDIVAYIYQAEELCPTCTIEALLRNGEASPAARDMNEETVLDQIAGANAIDRHDESSFDSDDFPKVVFASDADGEQCDACGEAL